MKSVIDLLNDLANLLVDLREGSDMPQFNYKDFDKAQQLVGQIRWKYIDETTRAQKERSLYD